LGLSTTVFKVWQSDPNLLQGHDAYAQLLRVTCEKDRAMKTRPNLRSHFVEVVRRQLRREKMPYSDEKVQPLAEWIYQKPPRAPSMRLGYEVFHSFINNKTHLPSRGEIADLTHLACTPYVDLITLDRTWRSYVRQVCERLDLNYIDRVCQDASEVVRKLSAG
jgi:hypothetical protein